MKKPNESRVSQLRAERKHKPVARFVVVSLLLGLALIVMLTGLIGRNAGDRNTATQSVTAQATSTVVGLVPIEGSEPAPVLGVVVDGNLKVVDVEGGSAAEKAGVQKGDILKKLDNTALTSPAAAMETARQRIRSVPGQKVDVVLQRGGQEIILQVLPSPPASRGTIDNPAPTPTAVPADFGYL